MTHYYKLLLSLLLLSAFVPASAQRHLWTGLRQSQPENQLPSGKAPFQSAQRVAKENRATLLQPVRTGEWIITEGWELADETTLLESGQSPFDRTMNTDKWLNATVPGTVLTTLVEQGVYPDPYFGLNNMAIPEKLCRTDWWYRCTFSIPRETRGERLRLLFNGINYMADIYLNGKKLGEIRGAFIRGEFDITALADYERENILVVKIRPPFNPGIPHEQSMVAGQGLNGGVLSTDGPTFISSMGWDWIPGIRDRNTGIWQDVRLLAGGNVQIGDPLITTALNLPDTTRAGITLQIPLHNPGGQKVEGLLTATIEKIKVSLPYSLEAGEKQEFVLNPEEFPALHLKNPRLWWPNGYGRPELYTLQLEVEEQGKLSDRKEVRFGIREMSYELMISEGENHRRVLYTPNLTENKGKPLFNYIQRGQFTQDNQLPTLMANADRAGLQELPQEDPVGPFLVIRVNGTRIFCRGGNWGMDDGMKRVSRQRLEPYLKLHRDAHFNIIRNWTGETTEEDFYALCDEYGMLVWNDFWITTDDTVEPSDFPLFVENATDVVRRFRNHPSIAIWCPRNEGFAPRELEEMLSAMLAREDPTRHYHGQSRFLNMGTSGPWGYFKDPSLYYTQNAKGFNTEMGTFAIPTANTIRKFIAPEDLWPINDVWAYHDLHHTSQNFGDFMEAVRRYGEPEDMEDFARKAQFVCYDAWRNMLEAWNSRMWNNTTGLVLWMSHPAWPSFIWQTYTYDYETPGSYFGAMKACEPLHIQMNIPDKEVMIINTTRNACNGMTASLRYFSPEGRELYSQSIRKNVIPNAATPCFTPEERSELPMLYLARLELKNSKGKVVSINDYWMTNGSPEAWLELNQLPAATLHIRVMNVKGRTEIEVSNPSSVPALNIKLNALNPDSNEILLPAYFSEGYFNLLPGEKRNVQLTLPADQPFKIVAAGYNVSE